MTVSNWFEKALNYEIGIKEIGDGSGFFQVVATDKDGNNNNIMDVGYGISQVLPIVTQIALTQASKKEHNIRTSPKTYIIEQPELHLHPNAQAYLASLFASAVICSSFGDNKLLIETHSEHLIRAIQVLIADVDNPYHLAKDMVKIYYVHDKSESPESQGAWIEEMKMDEYGQFLQKWPQGFFDKAYSLTSELMSAVNKRKHAEKVKNS